MMRPTAADSATLKKFAEHEAEAVSTAMRADLATALHESDALLGETLHYALFNGGKRIRPLLVGLAARLCGTSDHSMHLLGAAFEYLHVATLIHDDVIDQARDRRGRKSVVTAYGLTAAILTGDWLHARSMHLVARLTGSEGLELFCRATAGMVDGEFRQLRLLDNIAVSEEQYFAVITCKTARLIESACEIGALFAGANPQQTAALATYGHHLGTAFQIVDDLLDYLGDGERTGKKIGQDFVEGKITLPLIRALAAAAPRDREHLETLCRNKQERAANFLAAKELIDRNQGFSSARHTAHTLIDRAIAVLDIFPAATASEASESRAILNGLALYVLAREK